MAKLKTGRHTSAIKEYRKSKRRNVANRKVKVAIRQLAKKVELAVSGKNAEEAKALLSKCFSAWDKAAKVGVVHANAAARKKARLSAKVAKLSSASK